ncbi:FadR family transcriptional regulator [Salinisphaera sp. USBA-960]|uniref:FadR/GntR family transcriptional regulator n=1 Tax=Salinisphaera orenii TaxID=856731 RepID=UPI000DBE1616|nr:FadR family transcriptional regulator [Salifodinibacter halophilus]NNC25785.1 FadR family transcriptional regulator [Salifodinibacter halophilus]
MTDSIDSEPPNPTEALIRDIFAGNYQPGDFIPKEMAICERFGLSRTVVRRHLGELVDGNIIERISGYGSRVRAYADWNILDPTVTDWMTRFAAPNQEIQREILTFRLAAEPFVAMTAARHATAHDLVAMEQAFDGMGQNFRYSEVAEERRIHSDSDVAFHEAIFKATHNIVWAQLSHILRPSIYLVISESNVTTSQPQTSLDRHYEVMDAIRMRQPERAAEATRAVLQGTREALGFDHADAPVTTGLAGLFER